MNPWGASCATPSSNNLPEQHDNNSHFEDKGFLFPSAWSDGGEVLGVCGVIDPERNEAVLGGCSEMPIFSWMPRSFDFSRLVLFENRRKLKNGFVFRPWNFLGSTAASMFVPPGGVLIGREMWTVECPVELGNTLRAVATALHAWLEDARSSGNTSCAEFT